MVQSFITFEGINSIDTSFFEVERISGFLSWNSYLPLSCQMQSPDEHFFQVDSISREEEVRLLLRGINCVGYLLSGMVLG